MPERHFTFTEKAKESEGKYQILRYPGSKDCFLDSGVYKHLDFAVKHAISVYGKDFKIVTVVDWSATEVENKKDDGPVCRDMLPVPNKPRTYRKI